MDSIVVSALLGLVQGLTEFIPVSSTGHLILFEKALGFQSLPGKTFEVVVQLGSAFAVCCAYWRRLVFCDRRVLVAVLLATIPAGVLGFLCHNYIKAFLYNPTTVATSLIIGGCVFFWIERKSRASEMSSLESISPQQSLWVGGAQALALIPGVSRSGATIGSGVLVGMNRRVATEFSFLLAIPTLMGAGFYDVLAHRSLFTSDHVVMMSVGFATAFVSSFFVFRPLVMCIDRCGFTPFAWYRIALGCCVLMA
jgi:undecaprenyl-diphosphatase